MLADDYFRVAHHDVTGRPRLRRRVLSLGLAGALLGELLNGGHVALIDDAVVLVAAGAPADPMLHYLWGEVAGERMPQPVRVWLAYLADSAYRRVGARLAESGGVRLRRRLTRTVYVPMDMNAAAVPAALLSQKLRRGLPLEYGDACLAGLVLATGMDRYLLDGAAPEVPERLRWCVSRLWPPMLRLIEHTQAAVGDAVLSHRT